MKTRNGRNAELKAMLDARRRGIQEQVQHKIRTIREVGATDGTRTPTDSTGDPTHDDLDCALVEIQAQALENIGAALARLEGGDYGVCHDCDEEIPENRLRALPFATRCLTCQERAEQVRFRDRRSEQRRPPFAAVG